MRIFVAGPWGDFSGAAPEAIMNNIRVADLVGQRLVHEGHEVYIPHTMCRTWSGKFTEEQMQKLDNSFLEHWAEAIYRIPGESKGADAEVQQAMMLGLKVLG